MKHLLLLLLLPIFSQAQTPETRRYAIEVAGLRVGTMTATRQLPTPANPETISTLTSDVQVDILFYHLVIYYKVTNYMRGGQLRLSTVDARTNQGNFSSRTEWKNDHYDIVANQYKYKYKATETKPIRYTVTDMFFGEPTGQNRAFAEYFGDFFVVKPGKPNRYQAIRDGREDEYQYQNGQLVTLIKKNPLKNFIIRLL
ncbi:hypothetical protein CDA63_10720 [Hymenobacter amundsenii]|uniref:DUF3108 domain-containing protein n=1 Tax=Hymenobacter amundsenii TaxID=2006685 RepID=A0A246FKP6_9BACT|nr:DUF6134 family protein [Hymenobacter amundsenii]OWP63156.1 hypothetical protein CDA63_10720 [Hymenobacter amundsenii]